MILGIGNDVCNGDRINRAYERHGARFCQKILTSAEQSEMANRGQKGGYLAKRFAAKEAIYKAIAHHISPPPSWHDAEILNDDAGRPIVSLSPRCQAILDGIANAPVRLSLSLSDDAPFAFAVCIAHAELSNTLSYQS